jgi:hypothetical protein
VVGSKRKLLIKWSEHVNMFMYFILFLNMFYTHILTLVFMKWFVAMQIVGGKMDDSSKGRTWGKKCKLSNFFLYFCMDFLWIAWTLSTISFYTLRSVCVWFFFTSCKVFWSIKLSNKLWFWTLLCSFFQYFSPNKIILQQKGQEGTGFSGPNSNEQKHPHKFIFFLDFSSCKMLG